MVGWTETTTTWNRNLIHFKTMAIRYNGNIMGTVTIAQQRKDEDKPRKYKIQIRQGNCLAVFLNVYKEENPEDPKKCWVHQLMNFLAKKKTCLQDCCQPTGLTRWNSISSTGRATRYSSTWCATD